MSQAPSRRALLQAGLASTGLALPAALTANEAVAMTPGYLYQVGDWAHQIESYGRQFPADHFEVSAHTVPFMTLPTSMVIRKLPDDELARIQPPLLDSLLKVLVDARVYGPRLIQLLDELLTELWIQPAFYQAVDYDQVGRGACRVMTPRFVFDIDSPHFTATTMARTFLCMRYGLVNALAAMRQQWRENSDLRHFQYCRPQVYLKREAFMLEIMAWTLVTAD